MVVEIEEIGNKTEVGVSCTIQTCCSNGLGLAAKSMMVATLRESSKSVYHKKPSDTGNRTPGYRVRGDNVSHYTISDIMKSIHHIITTLNE